MSFRWRFGGAMLALALWLIPAVAEPVFPELTGRVVDDANLLSYPEEVAITADLKALEDKSSDQLVVVTLPSLQGYTIEDFGYQLGRRWGIGTAKWDNGVILVVAPNIGSFAERLSGRQWSWIQAWEFPPAAWLEFFAQV